MGVNRFHYCRHRPPAGEHAAVAFHCLILIQYRLFIRRGARSWRRPNAAAAAAAGAEFDAAVINWARDDDSLRRIVSACSEADWHDIARCRRQLVVWLTKPSNAFIRDR